MEQFSRKPVSTVRRMAYSFATGNTPGKPMHTGHTLVLGGAPKALAQPHHIFDFVLSWTCVSSPMTASYSIEHAKSNHGRARMHTDFLMCFRHLAGRFDNNE